MTCREKIIIKKRRGRGQGMAANAWGDYDTKSQSGGNLGNDGKGDEWLYKHVVVDKNKGDNYVTISLWLVISLVVPYVVTPMNLAFNQL